MDEPHGEVLGQITHRWNSYHNFFYTSFIYIVDFLYKLMFGNGQSSNSWISFLTSLLGVIPLCSQDTSLYLSRESSSSCIYFLVNPFEDAIDIIETFGDQFLIDNNKKYFLEGAINLLTWLELTNEIFDFPLCIPMMKYFMSLMR